MKKFLTIMLTLAMTVSVSAQQRTEKGDAQIAINNIMTRTSIRQYTDEPVSKENIETMLRAGMAAPTAVTDSLGISSSSPARRNLPNSLATVHVAVC